jgi:hypothetical protein
VFSATYASRFDVITTELGLPFNKYGEPDTLESEPSEKTETE